MIVVSVSTSRSRIVNCFVCFFIFFSILQRIKFKVSPDKQCYLIWKPNNPISFQGKLNNQSNLFLNLLFHNFILSYAGYCPQYKYRIGDTFGSHTHKLLIDPCAGHSEKILLSDRSTDDYHVERPTLQEIDIVKNHERDAGDTIYKYPTIPGYEGFVPRINGTYGQRFSVAATEGLAKFQMDNLRNKRKRNVLRHRGAVQEKLNKGRSLGERLVRNV